MDKKTLKRLNTNLASSACKSQTHSFISYWHQTNFYWFIEQKVRDEALVNLIKMMITEKKWVLGKEDSDQEDAVKNLRIIWEGLFFGM